MAIALLAITHSYAQEPADALRYSWLTQNGTGRNQAIGGAGASLGGEFSSLFINPAGLAFYKTNEFVFTPGYSLKDYKSTYKNHTAASDNDNFNLGASGFLISSSSPRQKIKSSTFAIGVTRIADFNKHIYYKGTNTESSYSKNFLKNWLTTMLPTLIMQRLIIPLGQAWHLIHILSIRFRQRMVPFRATEAWLIRGLGWNRKIQSIHPEE